MEPTWREDILPGHEQLTLELTSPDPDNPVATLVRRVERDASRPAILYIHGWNDYFFQTHLSDFFARIGYEFYALDLRRYGRSLREGQLGGYVTDLADYDDEIDQARELILAEGHSHLVLHGHSTGGLVACNHVAKRQGRYDALVLNSPWLDMHNMPWVRALARTVPMFAARTPTRILPGNSAEIGPGLYARSLHTSYGGEWDYDLALKSSVETYAIRAAWLNAVLKAQGAVARGLAIDCPVLVCAAATSALPRTLTDAVFSNDIVLDADALSANAVRLGPLVTVARIPNGMHDLALSREAARGEYFATVETWLRAYGPATA